MEDRINRLGVCSWSLQPGNPAELVQSIRDTGLSRVQLALDPMREDPGWADGPQMLEDAGITVASGMFHTIGEDYTSPATIRETGGVVPDEHWDANLVNIRQVALIASKLGLKLVSGHAGFIPQDDKDPLFETLVERLRAIADIFADQFGGTLILETGQETAGTLELFLKALDRDNVAVNFDPANMLLYDMGDPIAALTRLVRYVAQVHIKDAIRPEEEGQWGSEVVVGTGSVDWKVFLDILEEAGFEGGMMIEREAGDTRVADIVKGKEFIQALL